MPSYIPRMIAEEQRIADIVTVSQFVLSPELLLEEFERQLRKHGATEHPPEKWLAFLIEEVGEVAAACNKSLKTEATIELVQVIALAIQLARCLAVNYNPNLLLDHDGDIDDFFADVIGMYNAEPQEPPF